jgi:hypothetical protein
MIHDAPRRDLDADGSVIVCGARARQASFVVAREREGRPTIGRRFCAFPFSRASRNEQYFSGFPMFSGGAFSAKPPMDIFVEEIDGDPTLCHDVARD